MSDAMWDMEYDKEYDLKQEIIKICAKNNIEIPKLNEHMRSWELQQVLDELKKS